MSGNSTDSICSLIREKFGISSEIRKAVGLGETYASRCGRVFQVRPKGRGCRCSSVAIPNENCRNRLIEPQSIDGTDGYIRVSIRLGPCDWKYMGIHQVLAACFLDRPEEIEGQTGRFVQLRHLDGNQKNNDLGNLCWGTAKQNSQDRIRHGTQTRGEKQPNSKVNGSQVERIRSMYRDGCSQTSIAEFFQLSQATVWAIIRGRGWKHVKGAYLKRRYNRGRPDHAAPIPAG